MNSAKLINQLCEAEDAFTRVKRVFPNKRVSEISSDSAWVAFTSRGRAVLHLKVWFINERIYLMVTDHGGSVATEGYFKGGGVFKTIPDTDEALRAAGEYLDLKLAAGELEADDTAGEIRATLGEARESRLGISWPAVRKRIEGVVGALAASKTGGEIDVDVDLPVLKSLGITVRIGSYALNSDFARRYDLPRRYVFANVFTTDKNLTTSAWLASHSGDFSILVVDRIRELLRLVAKDAEKRSELADEIKSLE